MKDSERCIDNLAKGAKSPLINFGGPYIRDEGETDCPHDAYLTGSVVYSLTLSTSHMGVVKRDVACSGCGNTCDGCSAHWCSKIC